MKSANYIPQVASCTWGHCGLPNIWWGHKILLCLHNSYAWVPSELSALISIIIR